MATWRTAPLLSGVVDEPIHCPLTSKALRLTFRPLVGTRSMRRDTKSVVAGTAGLFGSKNVAIMGKTPS